MLCVAQNPNRIAWPRVPDAQVARRLKDGRLELVEVPDPAPGPGTVAVRVEASVLSAGTERATLDVARKGLLAKARARPDQARQVVERVRSEGVRSTARAGAQRLEELGPLGYSAAGMVIEVGPEARGLAPGDRVAIAGGGFANHAEVDVVPSLLCARVPGGRRRRGGRLRDARRDRDERLPPRRGRGRLDAWR